MNSKPPAVGDAALDASIGVGPILVAGARIALRHWLLVLLGILGMSGMLLLLLDLAGKCFGAGHEACISPAFFATLGRQKQAYIGDALILVPFAGAFFISVVVLRLFYLLEPAGAGGRPATRSPGLRPLWFVGRVLFVWLVIAAPSLVLDIGYRHAAWMLYPDYVGPDALWLGYILIEALRLALASYLHARTLLYLPSVAYQEEPDSFAALWRRTHPVRWRIFFVFFPIDVGITLLQTAFSRLAPQAVDFGAVADGLADWSDVDLQYVTALLPTAIIYAVVLPVSVLLSAGIAVAAYRKLVAIDHARAAVFD